MFWIKSFIPCRFKVLLLTAIFAPSLASAAACCGGSFATPALITTDDKAQMTLTYAQTTLETDVSSSGVWKKKTIDDTIQVYRLESAHIFKDRYQAGISLPIQSREKSGPNGEKSTGLGDVSAQMGYEYLPDWDYNPWRPRGVGFISLILPTGNSIYESSAASGVDSRGRGFWALGLGTALTKTWSHWDANSTLEIHRSFDKKVSNSQLDGTIRPGYGASVSIGTGYSFGDLRLGGAIHWMHEDPIRVDGSSSTEGSRQQLATGLLMASYMFEQTWAGTLSYADETRLGDPTNTSLGKTFALLVQKRWAR